MAQETLNKARNEGLIQGFLIDTSTLAYRCGGSPGIKEPLNKSFALRMTYSEAPLPGSRLTLTVQRPKHLKRDGNSTRIG